MSADRTGLQMSWREFVAALIGFFTLVGILGSWIILPNRVLAVEADIVAVKSTIVTNAERLHKMELDVSTALAVLVEQSKNQAEQTRRMQADITEIKNRH